ncbi:hypothetical protein BDB00DRAFT_877036 [Zychaea mexicana]|uniref:uncharacterized protein n=1 Tax=Zychaea mexicana TaxID=64656 RepID=UPI0022FF1C0E|nr:uncharacterized protein BDB00DRAFT_877036 [Zychaea mexicana]KAI9488871.1 hypothetical protein BDB00DRAFT_877036 [Zychaea mexicana]
MITGTEQQTAAVDKKEYPVIALINKVYARPVTLNDLKRTQEIVDLINTAFMTNASWTSVKSFLKGARVTYEEIEELIRETAAGNKRTMFICAFEKRWAQDKQENEESLVATHLIIEAKLPPAGRIEAPEEDDSGSLGYNSTVFIVFEARAEMIAWYRRMGARVIGVMKHPNPQRLKDKNSVYLLMKFNFEDIARVYKL